MLLDTHAAAALLLKDVDDKLTSASKRCYHLWTDGSRKRFINDLCMTMIRRLGGQSYCTVPKPGQKGGLL